MAARLSPNWPMPPLELVCSYNSPLDTQHFSYKGEYLTICGLNRENYMILREADLKQDLDSAYTCKRCAKKILA